MLSKTALSAVRAFAVLAELPQGDHIGAASIATRIGAGQNYLGKLLQSLSREGLVLSQKGLGGGFRLARPAEKITLFDVIEPIDQVSRWDDCFIGKSECKDDSPCEIHDKWKVVRDAYLAFLNTTTIADLAKTKPLGIKVMR